MNSPERVGRGRPRGTAAALAALALTACGCGKSNLVRTSASPPAAPVAGTSRQSGAPSGGTPGSGGTGPARVPLPLPLTSARAQAFARRVELVPVDLPGAAVTSEEHSSPQAEQEAARCGSAATVLGSGRSPKLHRGAGPAQEDVSSSVEVLASAKMVQSNLAYLRSRAGLACYEKVLRNDLRREESGGLRVTALRIARLQVGQGEGMRVQATVSLTTGGGALRVFIDSLAFAYGPAEVDLYATSFIQPEPVRTEQELLGLLRERAALQRL